MIYLDHNATTLLRPEAYAAMEPWLVGPFNASSVHSFGRRAARAVERAREQVAALLGRPAEGLVFCSGATEANHLAIRGLVHAGARSFAVSEIEHPSVKAAVAAWAPSRVTLSVDESGRIDVASGKDASFLCVMAANHETGTLQPVADAIAHAERLGGGVHVDATQAVGRLALDLSEATTVSISAHKIGGPIGVGALSLRDAGPFHALLAGGSQERGRRAGTLNVAGIVGFGEACDAARDARDRDALRLSALSARVRDAVASLGGKVAGRPDLPNTTCALFEGIRGETVVQALDLAGFAVSSGAACASGASEPSPVLAAMGQREPAGGVRISLGYSTVADEIEAFTPALARVLERIRSVRDSAR